VICTCEDYGSFGKQLLWPICYDTFILILNHILSHPHQVEDKKEVLVLVNAANSVNEATWEYFKFKQLFTSLTDHSSDKENLLVSIETYFNIINLLAIILSKLDFKEAKYCYANITESKFLLLLKAQLTMNYTVPINDFQVMILAFQSLDKDKFFNALKKYAKITHLLITNKKDLKLPTQVFNILMKAFINYYSIEPSNDFAYTLSKLARHLPQTEGAIDFLTFLLNSKDECCQLLSKPIFAFLKSISNFIPCRKINPNCTSCANFIIDLYTYQAYNIECSFDFNKIITHIAQSFNGSSMVLYDAIIHLFEVMQEKSLSVPLRELLASLYCPSVTLESITNLKVLMENIETLENITVELEKNKGSVCTICKGYFQILDLKLLLIRSLTESKDFKWSSFLGSDLVPIHKSISQTALKIYNVLTYYFKSLFGEIPENHSFRDLYNLSIGNSKFVGRVDKLIQDVPLNVLRSLVWYGNEAVYMLQYLNHYTKSQVILQYLITVLFYFKVKSKSSINKEAYTQIVVCYLSFLHQLFESYCNCTKDKKSKVDCLNFIQKCNERYKEYLTKNNVH